jgi:hypothetical protein
MPSWTPGAFRSALHYQKLGIAHRIGWQAEELVVTFAMGRKRVRKVVFQRIPFGNGKKQHGASHRALFDQLPGREAEWHIP